MMDENEIILGKKVNFQGIYDSIIDKVSNHVTEIFSKKVKERIKNLGLNADVIVDDDLTCFYEEDEFGKILIDGISYNLDPSIQILINIAVYEAVKEQASLIKLSNFTFYNELEKIQKLKKLGI